MTADTTPSVSRPSTGATPNRVSSQPVEEFSTIAAQGPPPASASARVDRAAPSAGRGAVPGRPLAGRGAGRAERHPGLVVSRLRRRSLDRRQRPTPPRIARRLAHTSTSGQ